LRVLQDQPSYQFNGNNAHIKMEEFPGFGSQPRGFFTDLAVVEQLAANDDANYHPHIRLNLRIDQGKLIDATERFGCTFSSFLSGVNTNLPVYATTTAYLEALAYHKMHDRIVLSVAREIVEGHRIAPHRHDLKLDSLLHVDIQPNCLEDPSVCECCAPEYVYFGHEFNLMDPTAIANLLDKTSQRIGFAIVPFTSTLAGTICQKELNYHHPSFGAIRIRGRDQVGVTMLHHHWVGDGNGRYDGRTFSLDCTRVVVSEGLMLVKIGVYAPGDPEYAPPPPPIKSWTDLADPLSAGEEVYSIPSGNAKLKPATFDWHSFGVKRIQLTSALVVFTTHEDTTVLFSRSIAWEGCRYFMNQHRDAACITRVTRWCTSQYCMLTQLPEELKCQAQLATIVFILSRNVAIESGALLGLIADCKREWHLHSELLAMRSPLDVTPKRLAAGVAWSGLSAYTVHSIGTKTYLTAATGNSVAMVSHSHVLLAATAHSSLIASSFAMPLVLPLWAVVTLGMVGYSALTAASPSTDPVVPVSWVTTAPTDQPELPRGVYRVAEPIRFGHTKRTKQSIPAQAEGTFVSSPRMEIEPTSTRVALAGIGFQEIPRYHASTAENEAIAIMSRLTLATPKPVPGLWGYVKKKFQLTQVVYEFDALLRMPCKRFYFNREAVSRYAAKFPPQRRADLLEAYDGWKRNGCRFTAEDLQASMFTKSELHVKPEILEHEMPGPLPEEATPRAIISFKPAVNATLGPLVAHYSDTLREFRLSYSLDHETESPICPRGVSMERISAWFTYWVLKFGGPDAVYTYDGDSVKHDAHHSDESLEASHDCSIANVLTTHPQVFKALDAQSKIRGKSAHGVIFAAEDKRATGISVTSVGNSTSTEMKSCYMIEKPNVVAIMTDKGPDILAPIEGFENLGKHYAVGAEGDDGKGVIRKAWADELFGEDMAKQMEARCLELGFEDKIRVHRGVGGEFCSRYWYPVGGRWLLGAKIGRTLAKAGFRLDKADTQTLRSAAIGALQDNYHVPFLREYFARVCEIAKKQKLKLGGRPNEYTLHAAEKHDYDESTLDFVQTKYGLSRSDLVEFKKLLDKVNSLPMVISWEHLHRCIQIDSA